MRVVRVKMAQVEFLRPLQGLCPLESVQVLSQDDQRSLSPVSISTDVQAKETNRVL